MSSLSDIYIKTETLETLAATAKKKGLKGIAITISTNDDSDQYGQNVSSYISQTKEEREAKKNRFYVGNGKVFWNNGKVTNGVKAEQAESTPAANDDSDDSGLPF